MLVKSSAIHLPMSLAMLMQWCALLLAEASICNLYHDRAPICIVMLLQKY